MRKYLVLTSLVLVLGFIQLSPAATWTIEQVTNDSEMDRNPFISTIGSALMVVYSHNDGDWEVFVASNATGSWVTSRVTDNTVNDMGFDIATRQGDNNAYIAMQWQDVPDREISLCKGIPGSWDIQRVTDDPENEQTPSIALDKNGFVHMAYSKTIGDGEIFYTNNVTGSWVSEQVTDNTVNDSYPWIALDSDGNPHIVFTDGINLWYTEKISGIWTAQELVAGGIGPNSFPFLVMDRNDYCHVSYSKSDGGDLEIYYANNVTGSWQESKVTTNDYDDLHPTLFVDPHVKVHIAYMADESGDAEIFYADNVAGVWSIGRVTDNSVVDNAIAGRFMIADPQGFGHIVFWNNSDGDNEIYHAKSDAPLFVGVEETSPQVASASLTINPYPSSIATISYSVPQAGNVSLKVYDVSGTLVKTLVDATKGAGEHEMTWNGATDVGYKATSGVYFFRLVAGTTTVSAKAILK